MSLFKKLTGALNTERKRNNKLTLGSKSVSCGNISGQERPPTPLLSDFISHTDNSDVDLGLARAKDTRHKSRLSKTTKVQSGQTRL